MNRSELSNRDNEQAVLSSIFLDNSSIIKIIDKIEPRDFYETKHASIYKAMVELFAKGIAIDSVSVIDRLKTNKECNNIYPVFLIQLGDKVPSAENILYNAERVLNFSLMRMLYDFKNGIQIDPNGDIKEYILKCAEKLSSMQKNDSSTEIDFFESINKAEEQMFERMKGDKKNIGFNWSSHKLTQLTGGIEIPNLYVFGALKKTGKSKFIIDQSYSLYQQKVPHLFLSLEMSKPILTRWYWSRFSKVDSHKIRYPIASNKRECFSSIELKNLADAKTKIEKLNDLLIVDEQPFLDLNQIKAKSYQAKQKLDIKVLLVDHLQRCNFGYSKGKNDAKIIEEFVYQLADYNKTIGIATILLSQIKNDAEERVPTMADLKHSGGVAEGVDFIGILDHPLRRAKDGDGTDPSEFHIHCTQRDGSAKFIKTKCDLSIGSFDDYLNTRSPLNPLNF